MAHPEREDIDDEIRRVDRKIDKLDYKARMAGSNAAFFHYNRRIEDHIDKLHSLEDERHRQLRDRYESTMRHRRDFGRLEFGPLMGAAAFFVLGLVVGSMALVVLSIIVVPLVVFWTRGKAAQENRKPLPENGEG